MAGRTASSRSLELLELQGYLAGVVERKTPFTIKDQLTGETRVIPGKTVDWLGFADILALPPVDEWWSRGYAATQDAAIPLLAVQATSGAQVPDHVRKLMEIDKLRMYLHGGHRCEIWGWRKVKNRGRRQWWPRVLAATLDEEQHVGFILQPELAAWPTTTKP